MAELCRDRPIPTGTIRLFPASLTAGRSRSWTATARSAQAEPASSPGSTGSGLPHRPNPIGHRRRAGAALWAGAGGPGNLALPRDGRAWSGMEAIIRIGARLGGPGRLLGIMRLCPRSVRNGSTGGSLTTATASGAPICAPCPIRSCAPGCSSERARRGGRKLVVTPDSAPWAPRPRVDNAMVKALARAFRWRKMLDDGVYATLEDLAKAGRSATLRQPGTAADAARAGHRRGDPRRAAAGGAAAG